MGRRSTSRPAAESATTTRSPEVDLVDIEPCRKEPVPVTLEGLFVLTAAFLAARGYCCQPGCRHSPCVVDSSTLP